MASPYEGGAILLVVSVADIITAETQCAERTTPLLNGDALRSQCCGPDRALQVDSSRPDWFCSHPFGCCDYGIAFFNGVWRMH